LNFADRGGDGLHEVHLGFGGGVVEGVVGVGEGLRGEKGAVA